MTDDTKPSDHIFYSLKELPGWYELLAVAADPFYGQSDARYTTGQLISTVLLAAGEAAEPIAVSGKLDETRSGHLVLIYEHVIVDVRATSLHTREGSFTTRVRPLTAATNLTLAARHNFYDGTEDRARTRGITVKFTLDDEEITLAENPMYRRTSVALQDEAFYAAFVALRDAR